MELSKLKGVINAAIAVAAVIPGVLLLSGIVDLPPDFKDFVTICGSILAPVMVMLSALLRRHISRLRPWMAAAMVATLLVGGFAVAFDYWQFATDRIEPISYRNHAFHADGEAYVVKPSAPSEELTNLLAGYLTISDAINDPNEGTDAARWLSRDSKPDQRRMYVEILLAETLLLLAFLIGAWRVAAMERRAGAAGPESAPR